MDEDEIYEGLGIEPPAPEEDPAPGEGAEEGQMSQEGGGEAPQPFEGGGESQPSETETPVEAPSQPPAGPTPPAQGGDVTAAQQAAIDQAYAAAFAGKIDPYTGRPITTKVEFDQYQAALQADQQRARLEQMRRAGVDPAVIQSIIDQHPVVREAQQVIQQAQAERERVQVTQAKGWYGEQLQQINALDPEAKVGSLDDLAAREPEQYAQMLGMVGRGVSLVDAYKMVHFDELAAKRAAAAKQAVMNQTAGKGHLVPSGGQGVGGVEVPGGVREMYRELNPDMTDAQISAAYAAFLKETQ